MTGGRRAATGRVAEPGQFAIFAPLHEVTAMAKSVFFFGDGHPEGDPKRRDLLGGKGAGLAEMTAMGLPVPPGFTIATDVCVAYAKTHAVTAEVRAEVDGALAHLEASLGVRLGDTAAPLLVSVRS